MKNRTLFSKALVALMSIWLPQAAVARMEVKPGEQKAKALSFIENKGQVTDQYRKLRNDIDFKVSVPGMNIFLGDGAIHYQWIKVENPVTFNPEQDPSKIRKQLIEDLKKPVKTTTYRMDVTLVGANKNAAIVREEEQAYYERYYSSQLSEQGALAHTYNRVVYKNVYPNIDWVLYTTNNELKYDFIVHPGGDVTDIKLKYEGATALAMKDGAVVATTPFGSITEQAPYCYDQQTKQTVASHYKLEGNMLSFELGEHNGTLVIDPTINWGTYYGGSNGEYAYGLASNPQGEVYMGGWTQSSNNIATTGAFQTSINSTSNQDAFIVKFNLAGVRQWGTYYGDTGADWFWAADVDPTGNVYLAGYTTSSSGIATAGAHQTTLGGNYDAMLVKFTSAGARSWATYYGGSLQEHQGHVSCDNSGNVFLSGETYSTTNIATPGAHQTTLNTGTGTQHDAFIAKFNSSGVRQWGTYYGGTSWEEGWNSTCDNAGNIIISGWTNSTTGIATTGSHQSTHAGSSTWDGYIAKFSTNGVLTWATYYGGTQQDAVYGVSCDANNNVYMVGWSYSSSGIATTGAYQTALSGNYDGFLGKFTSAGALVWCTYYGGPQLDYAWGIAATPGNVIYASGWTTSTSNIATANGYQTTHGGGNYDAFLLEMNSLTGTPMWCTYYGGSNQEWGYGQCAWSPAGYIYMSGYTWSSNQIATSNGHQTSLGGNYDAFLVSFITDTIVYVRQPFIDTVFCPGDSFKVAYGTTYGFNANNVFTVQLSNAAGLFTTPVNIGSKAGSIGDTVKVGIPLNTPPGTGYRIRIIASNPSRTSFDNGVNIRVKPIPANLTATSNSPVCENATLQLNATTTSTATTTYSWTGPASFTAGIQNPSVTNMQVANAGDYIVTAVSDGCIGHDTTTVVVNTIPAVPTVTSNSPVCPTTTLNLTASSTTAGVTYQWTGPNSFASVQQNPSIANVSTIHAGVYSVTATKLGCVSAAATATVQVHITTPTPVAGGNNVLCAGATLNLTASNISGATYEWEGPNNFNSTLQNPTIPTVQPYHSGAYVVRATVNGCISDPDTVHVQVNIVSTIGGYASPNDTICEGTPTTFVAIKTNGSPSPVLQWYKNFAPITGANGLLYTANNVATGDKFYCTMYSVGVCTDPILVSTDTIEMTVINNIIVPSVELTANPPEPRPGQSVTFSATVTNGGYKPTYQWRRNGNDILGAIYATWSANMLHPNDWISCVVTSSDLCANPKTTVDSMMIGFPTSVGNVGNKEGIGLYPNPNNGSFTITANIATKTATLEVVSAIGQVVYAEELNTGNGSISKQVTLPASVANGVYMLKVKTGEEANTLRFTVSR